MMSKTVQGKLTPYIEGNLYPQLKFYYKHKDEPEYIAEKKKRMSSWYWKNRDRASAYRKEHYRKNRETYKKRSRERYYMKEKGILRKLVLTHYGGVGATPTCRCCGESISEFLTIDHINGRKAMCHPSNLTGHKLYRWLVKNNFPEGFQVLCMNCNSAKGFFGRCPHENS